MKVGDLVRPISDSSWWGLKTSTVGIVLKIPDPGAPGENTYCVYFGDQELKIKNDGILFFPGDNHQLEVLSEAES